jgi:ABC-type iron transport system FetAB ATPase subunit
LDALSPTDGLIAEQLSGFIAEFVGKMNEIISKFWTYDIRVFPCGIENADLNYRFPVEILSEENQAPDVSEVSWGQKDLIDTAFKLVIALYLQRPEWPIYLDELGATFDETHHRKVLQFIKDYVDSGKASMAFIVSHYASSHTAMSDAELTILDTSNVTVLKDHNKHVVIS